VPDEMHKAGWSRVRRRGHSLTQRWRVALSVLLLGVLCGAWFLPGNPWRTSKASPRHDRVAADSVERQGFAMGTYVRLLIHGRKGNEVAEMCLEELARLETVFDRFKEGSEISQLNAQAGTGWVRVSEDLFAALEVALDVAERSEGALDPSVAPLVDLWGLREHDGRIPDHSPPSAEAIAQLLGHVNYQEIGINRSKQQVRLPQGMQLDMGAIAKGYALDRLVTLASAQGVQSALFDLGGNIRVIGTKPNRSPWHIALRHPRRLDDVFAVLPISGKAVATSGDYQRFFFWEGQRYSHILDPRTGYSSSAMCSATVVAPTGVLSDALSTAAFVLGPEKGRALVKSMPGVEAVFIDQQLRMSVTPGLEGLVAHL
jgi:thiamine biosynthesis lipoprotein